MIELALESTAAIRSPDTAILPLDVTITYRPEELRKPLVWERTIFAVVDRPMPILLVKSNRPVVLDGKLDEWPDLLLSARRPTQLTGAATVCPVLKTLHSASDSSKTRSHSTSHWM